MVDLAPRIHFWWGQGFDRTTYHLFRKLLTHRGIQVDLIGLDDSVTQLMAAATPASLIKDHERGHDRCRAVVLPCEAAILLRHLAREALTEQLQRWYATERTLVVAPPSVLALLPQQTQGRTLPGLMTMEAFVARLSDELLDKGPAFPHHCAQPVNDVGVLPPGTSPGDAPQPTGNFDGSTASAPPEPSLLLHSKLMACHQRVPDAAPALR